MDTHQLSAFIAVAESSSFTQAADSLHLTQPAVSKRINLLEQFLGNRLFDRIGRRVKLTEAGQILLPHAKKILREMEDTRNAVQNLSAAVSGRLAVASSHHVGLHRLPPVLKEYAVNYPDVAIDIAFLDSEKAYELIVHGDIEVAVVTLSNAGMEKIHGLKLWGDDLHVMTSPRHPLIRFKQVNLKDLLDYPAILPGRNTFTRQLIDGVFQEQGLQLEIEMSTNYLETIKMMVSVGMAWSVLPKTMLDSTLRVLPVRTFRLQRNLGYIYHREHTLSNAASAFIALLHKYGGNQNI
jgi:DNA-binding transcriptional LysR family regulator